MNFLFVAIFIGLICSVLTIRTLIGYSDIGIKGKIVVSTLVVSCWFSPFLAHLFKIWNIFSNEDLRGIYNICYGMFGFAFLLLVILLCRDLIWSAFYGIMHLLGKASWSFHPKNVSVLFKANIITVMVAVLVSGYAFYEGSKFPEITKVNFSSGKLKQDIKIVHLTDLHINRTTPLMWTARLVNEVNAMQPDIIVITGDLFDDKPASIMDHVKLIGELRSKTNVFVSMGNHEYYSGIYMWNKIFRNIGLKFLFNQGMYLPELNVFVSGVPDVGTSNRVSDINVDFIKALKNSNKEQYKVLLSHSPEVADYITKVTCDLQLSGHTHGGQIFPFHLLVKKANHYIAGVYKVNGVDVYVSRGAGFWGPQMRLLAPAEITEITVKGTAQN